MVMAGGKVVKILEKLWSQCRGAVVSGKRVVSSGKDRAEGKLLQTWRCWLLKDNDFFPVLFVYPSCPNKRVIVSHCGFDLHFPNN